MQRLVSLTPLPTTKGRFPSHRFKVHYSPFSLDLKKLSLRKQKCQINKSSVFRKESSKGTPFEVKSLRHKKGFMPSKIP